jgi:hypothetical protein
MNIEKINVSGIFYRSCCDFYSEIQYLKKGVYKKNLACTIDIAE